MVRVLTLQTKCIGHHRPCTFCFHHVHSGRCNVRTPTVVGGAHGVGATVGAVGTYVQQYRYRTAASTVCTYSRMGGVSNFSGGAFGPLFSVSPVLGSIFMEFFFPEMKHYPPFPGMYVSCFSVCFSTYVAVGAVGTIIVGADVPQ